MSVKTTLRLNQYMGSISHCADILFIRYQLLISNVCIREVVESCIYDVIQELCVTVCK